LQDNQREATTAKKSSWQMVVTLNQIANLQP
jgi:hypothetical protein